MARFWSSFPSVAVGGWCLTWRDISWDTSLWMNTYCLASCPREGHWGKHKARAATINWSRHRMSLCHWLVSVGKHTKTSTPIASASAVFIVYSNWNIGQQENIANKCQIWLLSKSASCACKDLRAKLSARPKATMCMPALCGNQMRSWSCNRIVNCKTKCETGNLEGETITAIKSHNQQSWLLQHGLQHSCCVWLIEDLLMWRSSQLVSNVACELQNNPKWNRNDSFNWTFLYVACFWVAGVTPGGTLLCDDFCLPFWPLPFWPLPFPFLFLSGFLSRREKHIRRTLQDK